MLRMYRRASVPDTLGREAVSVHKYVVIVDDNFHHMDEGEQYELGEFESCEAAIAACKKVVDDFLISTLKPHHSYEELWKLYTAFGDDAFIANPDRDCRFSGWDYARERCRELTQGKG